ncbi:outer membrane beta-barrel protein [Hugenholtzia roseola]|uniref:outer membrane beta-barrel protein n=1 Tax=Hugenholtzia roseola TaxID=1002 RepID=UPI00042972C1|nr:outer membrane beta-barrel protein [Hugenholtzia roseola]
MTTFLPQAFSTRKKFKKITIWLFWIIYTSSFFFSLSLRAQRLSWGLVGGLTYSKVANLDNKRKLSAASGTFLMYQFKDNWAIQQELRYLSAGAKMGFQGTRFTFRADYIESVTALHYLFFGQYFRWQAQTGLGVGYNTWATFDKEFDARPFVFRWDYHLMLGVGFRRTFGAWQWLQVNLRHRFGRRSVFNNAAFRVPHSIFSLDVAYSLPLLTSRRGWR